jgi:hypothetical protein
MSAGQPEGPSAWALSQYGDPCVECGYEWWLSLDEAVARVATMPSRYTDLLRGREGSERHPLLAWSAGAYVCHVTDNLRIWGERLAGAALGGSRNITGYDSDLLAEARVYERIPLEGALWSLGHAVREWRDAVAMATRSSVMLVHPDRGELTVLDVARANAHDAHHHEYDIRRSLGPQ